MFTYVTIVIKLSFLFSHGFIKCALCLMWVFVLTYLTYQVPIVAQNFNYFVRTYALIWVPCCPFTCDKIALTIAECFFSVFCRSALYFLVKFFLQCFPLLDNLSRSWKEIWNNLFILQKVSHDRIIADVCINFKKRWKGIIISMFLCSMCVVFRHYCTALKCLNHSPDFNADNFVINEIKLYSFSLAISSWYSNCNQ